MIPRGQAGGYTLSLPAEQRLVYSKKYFMDEIAIFLVEEQQKKLSLVRII